MSQTYRIRNSKLWVSKTPESSYNTLKTLNSEFEAITSQEAFYVIPTMGKVDDAGNIGTGTPFATHVCNDYWTQPGVALATQLEYFGIFARLWLRAFGQTVDTDAEGPAYKHKAELQTEADGVQLPASDIIVKLGPMDVQLGGMVVSQATLTRQRRGKPNLAFNLVGSGLHANPHGISNMPAYAAPSVCGATGVIVKYTNPDSQVVDLGALGCRFVDFNVSLNNNVRVGDQCPSDVPLTEGGGTGLYVSRLVRQEQTLDAGFTFLLDETNAEHLIHLEGENVTNVIIAIRGPLISGSTYYELGVEIPKAHFSNIAPSENDGDAAYSLTIQPLYDAGMDNAAQGYVISDAATMS